MSQRQRIVIIGVWVMIFLFLGFPSSWEKALAILTGLLVIVMAYRIKFKETQPRGESSFTDNVSSNANQSERADRSNDQVNASVIPAKAGIQGQTSDTISNTLDSRLHGNDKQSSKPQIPNNNTSPSSFSTSTVPTYQNSPATSDANQ